MEMGKVVGTIVATRKDEKLVGTKLQVVRRTDLAGEEQDGFVVAVDSVGAGVGELVLYARGSSARQTMITAERPVDAVIMAIVDVVELEGNVIYEKS
jgi:microcompartment protein CcmK/EutM